MSVKQQRKANNGNNNNVLTDVLFIYLINKNFNLINKNL